MNLSRCCRGSVDGKNHLNGANNLFRIYQANRKQRNLARWIEVTVKKLLRRNPEISMDQESIKDLSRKEKEGSIEREFVEKLSSLKKRSFSIEEKHIKMNATNKLHNQRSKQHIKLSKTYLNIEAKHS